MRATYHHDLELNAIQRLGVGEEGDDGDGVRVEGVERAIGM
jgi:hypothetical protein